MLAPGPGWPKAMQPWQLGAAEAARLIKRKELSPVELADSCLERADALDPAIRAWVTVDRDGARQAAAALRDRLAAGDPPGPLAGVPVGVKDVIDVAGLPTTASSKALADAGPAERAASSNSAVRSIASQPSSPHEPGQVLTCSRIGSRAVPRT